MKKSLYVSEVETIFGGFISTPTTLCSWRHRCGDPDVAQCGLRSCCDSGWGLDDIGERPTKETSGFLNPEMSVVHRFGPSGHWNGSPVVQGGQGSTQVFTTDPQYLISVWNLQITLIKFSCVLSSNSSK